MYMYAYIDFKKIYTCKQCIIHVLYLCAIIMCVNDFIQNSTIVVKNTITCSHSLQYCKLDMYVYTHSPSPHILIAI